MTDFEKDLRHAERETEECVAFMQEKMEKCIDIFRKKNPPYGNSFFRSLRRYGIKVGVARLFDKFSRIESLLHGTLNTVPDETVEDTLVDLANYSLMMAYAIHKSKEDDRI